MIRTRSKNQKKYLRTISDPPGTVNIDLEDGRKFLQCQYGWWDHSIALGRPN